MPLTTFQKQLAKLLSVNRTIDIHYAMENILPLGALCWAAVGKDPGLNPSSLLTLIKRRGKYRVEDFKKLKLNQEVDLIKLKEKWIDALTDAETFIQENNPEEIGCLYYDKKLEQFVQPNLHQKNIQICPHFGKIGGILPQVS